VTDDNPPQPTDESVGGSRSTRARDDDDSEGSVVVVSMDKNTSLRELKTMCSERDISDKGTKGVLALRIREHDAERSGSAGN
tara:strand:+ start:70 stop:315 length:246 start_codon:yes stop_codon:yes gene_type:complete